MNRAIRVSLHALLALSITSTLAVESHSEETYRDRMRFIPDTEVGRAPGETNTSKPIKILNAKNFQTDTISAERVYLGQMYKPCVMRLPDDTLRLSAAATTPHYRFGKNESPLWKSTDGGRVWSKLSEPPFLPSENYMSVLRDGTVLMTFAGPLRDRKPDSGHHLIHRSTDGGLTWQHPPTSVYKHFDIGTRNVLELADGSLLWGHTRLHGESEKDMIWRSFDGGHTWTEKYPARFEGMPQGYPYSGTLEAFLWQSTSGRLFCITRVDFLHMPPIPGKKAPSREWMRRVIDESTGMLMYASDDMGRSWKPVRYLGDYGQHYPSILKLRDGRLLLTYTVRSPVPHETGLVGTSAVLGRDEGEDLIFDFNHDVIELEARLPYCRQPYKKGGPWIWNPRGAAGWSPTVQLDDGTLVTAYSYRTGTSDDTGKKAAQPVHSEVIRWRLPKIK